MKNINNILSSLTLELGSEILTASSVNDIAKGTVILKEGQYVKVIPIVINGLIKVFSSFGERELLLYYIQPGDSCIMSFAASLKNDPSKVYAITEEDTEVILMPVDKVLLWIKQFPDLNTLFYQQYNLRYTELLDTIDHVLFNKMDIRLHDYLNKEKLHTNNNIIKKSHGQIANELGTAREVVSRVMKKLVVEGKVKQHTNYIEIL